MFFTDGVFVHELVVSASAVHLGPASVIGEDAEPVAFMVSFFEAGLANVCMRIA